MNICSSYIRRFLGSGLLLLLLTGTAHAQVLPRATPRPLAEATFDTTRSILQNSVATLRAAGDTLWAGPFLSLTPDGGDTWLAARADSLHGTRNSVFSLDVEDNLVWAGLGYLTENPRSGASGFVQAGGGLLLSRDGGQSFSYMDPPLDTSADTAVAYGDRTIQTLLDDDEAFSPPYALDYVSQTQDLWLAAGEGGLRRTSDFGQTWERVVLPPDTRFAIAPDSTYPFLLGAQQRVGEPGNQNHTAYSVLADEGAIWVGTSAGLNRSTDGGESWRRFTYDGTSASLTGDFVVALARQPSTDLVWIASWSTGQEGGNFGVTVSRDSGRAFQPVLLTEGGSNGGVLDFAFRGDTVYAAAQANGLLSTTDGGQTWESERTFGGADAPFVYVVATTPEALWVGTSLGLFKSTDGGQSWRSFRVEVPLDPEEPTDAAPRVEAFAYPNPFSPSTDRRVRIRYDGMSGEQVEVRIFDFNMNLVRTLHDTCNGNACSIAWNGVDSEGLRVANGAYFYVVEAGGTSAKGKILVLQ